MEHFSKLMQRSEFFGKNKRGLKASEGNFMKN